MNRIGTCALVMGIAAAGLALPWGAAAQAQTVTAAAGGPSRVDELVKYARERFEQSQAQPAPSGAQQQTLEEKALARPVTKLTVDQAVAMALENNLELSIERLNPRVQDLSIDQLRGALPAHVGVHRQRDVGHAPADELAERRQRA